jgi:hypothetical protein
MKKLVLIALLAHSADALACGDDDGGGTLNLGDDSSSSSSNSCTDSSDVVGYRQCTTFGKWSESMRLPLIFFELGTSLQRFDTPLREGTGNVTHEGEDFSYRVVSPTTAGEIEQATAMVASLRVGVASRIGLYTAAELEVGGLVHDPTRMEMTSTGTFGSPDIEKSSAVAFGGLAVVGFQRGTKHLLLGAEVAGGFRGVSYQYDSHYLACEDTTSIVTARGVLEARARAAVFISPNFSIGAQLGSSLVDDRTWTGGVFLGGYTRSFAR